MAEWSSLLYVLNIIRCLSFTNIIIPTHYSMLPMTTMLPVFEKPIKCFNSQYDYHVQGWLIITGSYGPGFDDNHIIFYHMDAQQSTGMAWTYFANPDYLVLQCWVHATFLSSDTINQTESHVYHYINFLRMWWVICLSASHIPDLWL